MGRCSELAQRESEAGVACSLRLAPIGVGAKARDPSPRAQKLSFRRDRRRLRAYAYRYHFGRSNLPSPLLIYNGGAISRSQYLARSSTEPTPVIAELEAALEGAPLQRLDALICPCPVDTAGEGLDCFVDHFEDELLPELGARPSAVACMGFSAGAAYAMHLAIVEEARAIVSLGGTGVLEAARQNRTILDRLAREGDIGPEVALFRNDGDQVAAVEGLFRNMLRPLHVATTIEGTGSHKFSDYARNGSVAAGFRFLLERLSGGVSWPQVPWRTAKPFAAAQKGAA